jgi:uncharacterized protein (DUF1330 family)
MRTVEIDSEAVLAAARAIPKDQPVIMINLLRFREKADYSQRPDVTPCTGREAYYERYAPVASPLVEAGGAKIFWLGRVLAGVIGPPDERWDDVLLVQYPSFAVLQKLFANPAYQAVVFHRTAALEDSRLIASATNAVLAGFDVLAPGRTPEGKAI